MSNLAYLFIAVALSAVGVLVLWLRNRSTTSTTSSIDEFHEKMRALAPEPQPDQRDDLVVRRRRNRGA